MSQRWCSLCYHQNRDSNGIFPFNEIDTHYLSQHASIKRQGLSIKSYPIKFNNNNQPYLFDDIPHKTLKNDSGISDIDIFLHHVTTETDIINRIQYHKQYPILFCSKPIRSSKFNYDWCISVLWSDKDELYIESIKQLMPLYPDLINKLESEYSYIMDDILNRTPKNLSEMSFKTKTLQIIREIKRCQTWIKYFLKPVNEIEDFAPNYFKIINEPMDIESLKQFIECDIIKTPKQFAYKLMLIWQNAQKFNPITHKIHLHSIKCSNESQRLLQKYFPELICTNNNPKTNLNKIAMVKYNSNNIRKGLFCIICGSKLDLLIGFHTNCSTDPWNCSKNCNNCKRDLNDISIGYYHCINGCQNTNNSHSIYLCEICASENKYNSQQIPNGYLVKDLPLNGLWVDINIDDNKSNKIFYEAIICYQESNRMYYEIVFSSQHKNKQYPFFGKSEGNIFMSNNNNNNNELRIEIENEIDNTDFTIGKLNIDYTILRFIDKLDEKNENIYAKVIPKCPNCIQCNNSDTMIFMRKNTIPTTNIENVIYCDVHSKYYEKQEKMNANMRCISFDAFKYDKKSKNKICEIGFYFTCVKCKNFDICAGCVLIQMELNEQQELNNNNNNNLVGQIIDCEIEEPPQKKMRNINNLPLKKRRIVSKSVIKKDRKKCENSNNNNNNNNSNNSNDCGSVISIGKKRKRDVLCIEIDDEIDYKELYMKEKEKNNKLLLELKEVNDGIVLWKGKYNKLYSKVQGVLLKDMKSSPRKSKS